MKQCSKCKEQKPLSDFAKNAARKDGLQGNCKSCHRQYVKRHYKRNTDYYVDKARVRNQKLKEENFLLLVEYLQTHPCVDCNETDIVVLQFDHLMDKKYNISEISHRYEWTSVLKEIAKCEVVCANCHTRRTAARAGWRKAHW